MNRLVLRDFIELRTLVGYLGEKSQGNWWDTMFLSSSGLQYLAIPFPRTPVIAAISATTEAARQLHDEKIGKCSVFHLFRLPLEVEEQLHDVLLRESWADLREAVKDCETALATLRKKARDGLKAPEGPVQVGTKGNLLTPFAVEELAKHYYDAFFRVIQTFPYFLAS